MKYIYSFVFILIFFTTGYAQFCDHTTGNNNINPPRIYNHLNLVEPIVVGVPPVPKFNRTSNYGTAIGHGPNAYGVAGIRSNVSADKKISTVTFIHRSDYLSNNDNSSGSLRYDVSFDGGTTWTKNEGPIWNPFGVQGSRPGPARYPNMSIFNPDTNYIGSKAYTTFFASTTNGDNDNWGGQLHGTHKLNNYETYAFADTSGNGIGWFVVNSDFEVAGERAIGLNFSQKSNGISYLFKDTLIVHSGVWKPNLHEFDYNINHIPMSFGNNSSGEPVFLDAKVALDSTGNTGYISVLGYSSDYHTYGLVHPIIYKTTDGGDTWSPARIINLDSLVEQQTNTLLLDIYNNADSNFVTQNLSTGSEHDIIVDRDGNPHICINVFPAGNTIINSDGSSGDEFTVVSTLNAIVDIYSTDGGSTWKSRIVGNPASWRGEFGIAPFQVFEENRPQIAKNDDGSKIFFFWFDTDPVWGTTQNILPDAWMSGYDIDKDEMISGSHRIAFSGDMTFGNVAPQVWNTSSGSYKAHIVTQELNPNGNGSLTHPTQFVYYPVSFHNNIGMVEETIHSLELSQNYPNPVNGITSFDLKILFKSNFSLSVTNLMGQEVVTKNLGTFSQGNHTVKLDLSQVSPGVYFYTVSTNGDSITKKLIVE